VSRETFAERVHHLAPERENILEALRRMERALGHLSSD